MRKYMLLGFAITLTLCLSELVAVAAQYNPG